MKKHTYGTKLLSVLLSLCMLMSVFSVPAFAENSMPQVAEEETAGVTVSDEAAVENTAPEAVVPETPAGEDAGTNEQPETPAGEEAAQPAEGEETPAAAEEEAPETEEGADEAAHATVEDFANACAAMGDAGDEESIKAVLASIEAIYATLSDEDKAAVAEQWAYVQSYAASVSAGNPDAGIAVLASGYTPVTSVGIYPDKKPAGNTATGKVRNSGQSLTMKVGQKASFLLGAPTNTLVGEYCGHTIAVYNPSDYCDISLIDNSGQNIVGNPTYAAGNNNGERVFDTIFEALKPGTSSDVRVCYYANFGIVFTNGASSAYVACPRCGRSCLVYKDTTWYRYNDVFAITVNADYVLIYDTQGGSVVASTTKTVADTSATLNVTSTVPTKEGYTFKGWAETEKGEVKYKAGDSITLNWSEGLGSEANPVSKTLYAVWEEDKEKEPEAPKREDLYGIMKNFVKVECVSEGEGLPHNAKLYSTVGTYKDAEVGGVTNANGVWTCEVTLHGDAYVTFYGFASPIGTGVEHKLAPGEEATKTITLQWDASAKKWTEASEVPVVFTAVCASKTPTQQDPQLTDFEKTLVRTEDEAQAAGIPTTGITFPGSGEVKIGTDGVTLLYKITVTGDKGASYIVSDNGATHVGGAAMKGKIPEGGSVDIYVTMTFQQDAIDEDGKVVNEATVDPDEGTDLKGPGSSTDKSDAKKQFTVTIDFETDDGTELKEQIKDTYDEGDDYNYSTSANTQAALFAARAAADIPVSIEKDGKTYVLDTVATLANDPNAFEKLQSNGITGDVQVKLIYSLDEKGENGGPDGIPDKYQVKVTFKVENGNWNDKTGEDKVVYLTKVDASNKWSVNGSASLTEKDIPAVGSEPKTGYIPGSWDTTPNTKTAISKDTIYTYTYTLLKAPTHNEVYNLTGNVIVKCLHELHEDSKFDCIVNSQGADHTGRIIIGEVEGSAQSGYTCEVTFLADAYADAYSKFKPVPHTLVSGQEDQIVTFRWNADSKKWETKDFTGPVTFLTECEKPAPEVETVTATWMNGYDEVPLKTEAVKKDISDDELAELYPEAAPEREGYTFTGWSDPMRGEDGNITITAQWRENDPAPVVPVDPTPVPPTPVTPVDPTPAPTPTPAPPVAPVVVTPTPEEEVPEAETPMAPPAETVDEPETPMAAPEEELDEEETPMAAPGGAAWALLNLILMLCTILASVLLLLDPTGRKQKDKEEERKKRSNSGMRLASLVPAIGALVAFLLTEDMRLPMVLTDRWTLLMVLIALVQLTVCVLAKRKQDDSNNNTNPGGPAPAHA